MRKIRLCIFLLILAFFVGSPTAFLFAGDIAVAEAAVVKISQSELTLTVGKTKTIELEGTDKKVTWKSSKESVASVSSKGEVTAKAVGTATIAATADGKKYTCIVTVKRQEQKAAATSSQKIKNPLASTLLEYSTAAYLDGIVKLSVPESREAPTEVVTTLAQLKDRVIYLNNYCKSGSYKIELSGFTLNDIYDISNTIFNNHTLFGEITYFSRYSQDNSVIYVKVSVTKTLCYEIVRGFEDESYYDKISTATQGDAKEIYSYVKDILTANILPEMTDYEKEKAIHDYLVNHYSYDLDLDIFTVKEFLMAKEGVCQAYAETFQLLMNLLGIPCLTQSGLGKGVDHAWNIVMLDGEWYNVDVTWDDPVSTKEILRYDYFNITDMQLGKTHSWEPMEGVSATATKYAYRKE